MKFKTFISILFLHMSLLSCAQWSTNPAVNNIICNLAGEQAIPKVAVCANGDTYFGYFSSEGGNYNVRLQKLDVQGNILWVANGILISNHPQNTWLTDWDMTCDASNHAILAFNDIRSGGNTNVVAYRISPAGTFVWGADGIMLSNSTAFNAAPKVTVTAAGNAVFAWQADNVTIIQKISPTGTKMWGTNGITLSGSARYTWPQLLPVGSDDVILKYFLDTGPSYSPTRHVYAQRYNASGSPVWATPAAISTAGGISAWTQIFSFINDGSDGFYIAWHDDRDNNMLASSYVQHINSSGSVVFTANGVEVSLLNTMNHFYPSVAQPTGSTDVFVFWNEMNSNQNLRGIYGQKVNAAGALQWTNSGMAFIPVSATNVYPYDTKGTPTDVVVFYEEYFNAVDGQIKAMRIAPNGTYVWSPAQKTICSVQSEKVHPVVSDLNNNQWILGWEDDRTGDKDIYAQNIQLNGDLGPVVVTTGTISGNVSFTGGVADVTQTTITAGGFSTHPDANGDYALVVPAATYSVTASHPYANSQTINNVVVTAGMVTQNVNFVLTVVRTDLVCMAITNTGFVLNDVYVDITGPEGNYTGTITQDSLIFENVPYGLYTGTATWGFEISESDTIIGENNHHLIFPFITSGIRGNDNQSKIAVFPNPVTHESVVSFSLSSAGSVSIDLVDIRGRFVNLIKDQQMDAGKLVLDLTSYMNLQDIPEGLYLLTLSGSGIGRMQCKLIIQR
ncbi:MAG: T9SS type A sorting domain-containing protein [Bacteroidetes bacterium]|nr:T9SS type A sorting domain-containing protein [Bacteroidota bacterium]